MKARAIVGRGGKSLLCGHSFQKGGSGEKLVVQRKYRYLDDGGKKAMHDASCGSRGNKRA